MKLLWFMWRVSSCVVGEFTIKEYEKRIYFKNGIKDELFVYSIAHTSVSN